MKNLKKLSVVLFATLLSFNFTSCIDDGVSDAVDQVYLAQAEFLRAQAALKEAEAQEALARAVYEEARAAYELARAEVELADARYTDAETDGVILDNERTAEENMFIAQENIQKLAKMQAELEVVLQEQLTLLAEAQSAHEVAMVNLGEAVAKAKDALILEYYADYSVVVSELQGLYAEKIQAEHDLAIKELMLVDVNAADLVSRAYHQAMLEAQLADSEAKLLAKQAALEAAMAITADDASDAQKWVTDLYNQAQAIIATNNELRVEREQASIAVDLAWEEWLAASDQYADLMAAAGLVQAAQDALDSHLDNIEDAEDAIAEAEANIAAIPAAEAAVVAVDTTTAYNGILAAMQVVEDKEDLLDDAEDLVDDAEDAYDDASDAYDAAEMAVSPALGLGSVAIAADPGFTGGPLGLPFWPAGTYSQLFEWEFVYSATEAAVASYSPGAFTIAELEQFLADADAEEQVAQAAWEADPAGFVVTDDPVNDDKWYGGATKWVNDRVGDATDVPGTSYLEVATWQLAGGLYYPASYVEVATIPAIPVNGGGVTYQEFDDTAAPAVIPDFATTKYFVEVEADDLTVGTYQNLVNARFATFNAQVNLTIAQGGLTGVTANRDYALTQVIAAYAALGYTYPTGVGTPDFSDILVAQAYLANLMEVRDDLHKAWNDMGQAYVAYPGAVNAGYMASSRGLVWNAEKAVAQAEAALGTDFRTGYTDNAFLNEFEDWYKASMPVTTVTSAYVSTTIYERFEDVVNADGDIENVNELPHQGTSITAYQALRNAYFERMWAMEELAALQTVNYTLLYDVGPYSAGNDDWPNAVAIAGAGNDIALESALIPSHEYALADITARFDALMAEFDFDLTLWDLEGLHGLPYMLADLPLYSAYLDAVQAENEIQAEIDANFALRMDIVQLRQAVVDNLIDDVTIRNVDQFMDDVADQIDTLEGDIADLEDDIENETALVAIGIIDTDTAAAWIAECERQLEVLNTKIEGFETAAASLLARINALLN
jgi:hypothetical protein